MSGENTSNIKISRFISIVIGINHEMTISYEFWTGEIGFAAVPPQNRSHQSTTFTVSLVISSVARNLPGFYRTPININKKNFIKLRNQSINIQFLIWQSLFSPLRGHFIKSLLKNLLCGEMPGHRATIIKAALS